MSYLSIGNIAYADINSNREQSGSPSTHKVNEKELDSPPRAVRGNRNVEDLLEEAWKFLLLKDFDRASQLAKAAYRGAKNGDIKFTAARLNAKALASQGKRTLAQLWLRKSRQFAPNQILANEIAHDYRFLANQKRWSTRFRFNISPSSNINNGSINELVPLFGLVTATGEAALFELSGDALALSGLEISGGFTSSYRLRTTAKSATFFNIDGDARSYVLSDEAQSMAPEAKGSDFSEVALGFGLTHRQILMEGAQPTSFSARLGQTWYGGNSYSRTYDLAVSHDWALNSQRLVGLKLVAQQRESLTGSDPVRTYGIAGNLVQGFGNGDQLSLGLALRDARSDAVDSDFDSAQLSLRYSLGKPIAGVSLAFGITFEERNFDASTYGVGSRKDQLTTINLSAQLNNVEYYGFQPVISFQAARNNSTLDLFERRYTSIGLNLSSSF